VRTAQVSRKISSKGERESVAAELPVLKLFFLADFEGLKLQLLVETSLLKQV
jgi:hypothetical protein